MEIINLILIAFLALLIALCVRWRRSFKPPEMKIKIEEESVIASKKVRLAAFLIDGIVIGSISLLPKEILFGEETFYLYLLFHAVVGTIVILYFPIQHGLWGQTIGKRILKTRVVSYNHMRIQLRQAFRRDIINISLAVLSLCFFVFLSYINYLSVLSLNALIQKNISSNTIYKYTLYIASFWFLIDALAIYFFANNRTVHDLIGKTHVIKMQS